MKFFTESCSEHERLNAQVFLHRWPFYAPILNFTITYIRWGQEEALVDIGYQNDPDISLSLV